MWSNVKAAPADSILGITEAFRNDPSPNKVNLGVGVYKDETGNTPILQAVKRAERILLEKEITKSYLPIPGDPGYGTAVQELLFGSVSDVIVNRRAATVHTPGGTGALRVGADLLKRFVPQAKVWVSSPTWANHRGIFGAVGFTLAEYEYFDHSAMRLDFQSMLGRLNSIPAGDIVLLHACCHNPSGFDLTDEQWDEVVSVAQKQKWIPFLDFAYQGFGTGLESDSYAVRRFAATGMDCFVASSFSKNFGLYNERTGAFTIISPTQAESVVAMSHLKKTVRVLYSNPPAHGGLVVSTILHDQELRKVWEQELTEMRERIIGMRKALVEGLASRGVARDFSYIIRQRGMFSFSGLEKRIVDWLREKRHIYMVEGGRINLAGLATRNIEYVCDSIAEALKEY